MATTAEQLLKRLVESGVWSDDDLAAARPSVSIDGDGEKAARELIKQGRLTKFQAQQLLATKPGVLVLGNYVLLDKIGAGGMGQVFKAEHRRMKRTVALKVLPLEHF